MSERDLKNYSCGMLLGLAIGDALGAPIEFGFTVSDIAKLGDKIENYYDNPRGPSGAWTDDTSMALCLADSLVARKGYDSYDIMTRYYNWMRSGYRAHPDMPLDIGMQTLDALHIFHRNAVVHHNAPKTRSAGNACIMRLAPIVIANLVPDHKYTATNAKTNDITIMLKQAKLSCMETHNSLMAETVTIMFATTLYLAICGYSKRDILKYCDVGITQTELKEAKDTVQKQLSRVVDDKTGASFRELGGYCLDTFLIALWGLVNFENFKDGMLAVIRLGGDTDTNGAVYGQLAGAFYGRDDIPQKWIKGLYLHNEVEHIANDLLAMKSCPIIRTRFEGDKNFIPV